MMPKGKPSMGIIPTPTSCSEYRAKPSCYRDLTADLALGILQPLKTVAFSYNEIHLYAESISGSSHPSLQFPLPFVCVRSHLPLLPALEKCFLAKHCQITNASENLQDSGKLLGNVLLVSRRNQVHRMHYVIYLYIDCFHAKCIETA